MDVGVIGLGLVGGSIAMNLSQDFPITGYDVDIGVRGEALARGAIAHAATSLAAFSRVKLIFIATPPAAVVPTLIGLAGTLRPDAVVTDCAGAKWGIVEAVLAQAPTIAPQFVGGHPMAGRERGGLAQARRSLFENSAWILTPTPVTQPRALEMVAGIIPTFGAHPVLMTPAEHDETVALLSHVPHVLAGMLVLLACDLPRADVAAGSWSDLTRVAGADPVLWTDIVMANRKHLSAAIANLGSRLSAMAPLIEAGDRDAIHAFFTAAKKAKDGSHT
ncbi:MAG TPA: prephenate dehydrogenase/arogenate dehydrogenase family protein [Fimbriimonadaceae bacterium]|nr:prephenate dehydrogenase/arogenate dehydrogenase family protein [Fimbriimonadaceae bacterium]